MTIKELLVWVCAAIDWHEANWQARDTNKPPYEHKNNALNATRPANANDIDWSIAETLLRNYWNDTQFWLEAYPT